MSESHNPIWEYDPAIDTPRSYEAFLSYRGLGVGRSYAKVGKLVGKSAKLIERWGRKGNWVERAEAFDNSIRVSVEVQEREQAEQIQKERLNKHREQLDQYRESLLVTGRNAINISHEFKDLIRLWLVDFKNQLKENPEKIREMKFSDVCNLAKACTTIDPIAFQQMSEALGVPQMLELIEKQLEGQS